jgi:Tfp pilus assembly protein PilF/TolB-like protein
MKKRWHWSRNPFWIYLAGVFLLCASRTPAQHSSLSPQSSVRSHRQEGIFLVFPFENAGAPPRLDWIGEGLEELTIQRLAAAGQQVYSHDGRINEMDRYGLPASARLSRATMIHIAQELDADYIVYGNFASDGKTLTLNARLLRVNPIALLPAVHESGPLDSFMELHTPLVWRLLGTCDRNYPLSLNEFSKLQRPLQLTAFEQYVRGLLANDDDIRLRNLKEAVRLEPSWPDPAFAIGQVYFTRNDCNAALPWFAKVPAAHERSVEAIFSIGVCRLRIAQPDKAEEVFASLQEDLRHDLVSGADLPEILNNLALARAQQGNAGAAQTALGRARDIDPDEDAYPFNLGLLALQANDFAAASSHFAEAALRQPDNPEDRAFLIYALEKSGKKAEANQERDSANEAFADKLPSVKLEAKVEALKKYERVKRKLDTTSLRLELHGPENHQEVDAGHGPHVDTPSDHIRRGREELAAGRIDSAEKEFRTALLADPKNAAAHRELAEICRRRGKLDEAIQELLLSLAARDSAAVRTTLARIYLEQKKPDLARVEVEKAVKLAPNYAEAKELLQHLQQGKSTGGKQ